MNNYQELYGVFYSDGHMTPQNVKYECQKDQWVPLTVHQNTVFLCISELVARNFSKRNLPKHWTQGAVLLQQNDIDHISKKGFNIELLTFPKKLKDKIQLGFEIFELQSEPDLFYK